MQIIQIIAALFLSFSCSMAMAEPTELRLFIARSGFMGKGALGLSAEFADHKHTTDLSLGVYDIEKVNYYQLNFSYRYSQWKIYYRNQEWRPLQIGIFGVYSLDYDRFFYDSPTPYPTKDYYEQTRFRYGLEISTNLTFVKSCLGLSYHLRVFDTGLTASFNNQNRDLQYYMSSGVSLQYIF